MTFTDREKHLSLALDALMQARETLDSAMHIDRRTYDQTMTLIRLANAYIEAAAMPRPSIIRRLITRRQAA